MNTDATPPKGLLAAVTLFLIVTFARPQDIAPALGALKPGMLAAVAILVLWLMSRSFGHLRDSIFKWQVALLGVLLAGIAVVVNHPGWFYTSLNFAINIVGLTFGLVAIARFRSGREKILKLLLAAYLFQAVWAISHEGRGSGAYFGDENDAAAGMIVGGSLAYAIWMHWPKDVWRWVALIAVVLSMVGIVVTESRGGFVGLVATVVAALFFSGRLLKTALLLALLIGAAYPFVSDEYKADMASISDPEDETRVERIYSWNRAIDLWREYPVIGVGAGNFPWRVVEVEGTEKAFQERRGRRMLGGRVAHSLYFTLLPENGSLGVLCYFALVIIAFRRAHSVIRQPSDGTRDYTLRTISLFLAVGLVGYSVAAVFISVLWYPHFWLMAALAILLSPAASCDAQGTVSWPQSTQLRRPRAARRRSSGAGEFSRRGY
jgi:O-antigen ligase